MIINIAGTSGAGKSHLVREFLKWAEDRGVVKSMYYGTAKQPTGYDVILKKRARTLHVVGPYEKADTAGCDILRNVDEAYHLIQDAHDAGKDVLFEGLFMMNMTRGPQLVELYGDVVVLQLDVPLAVCLASINGRRERRGEGKLLNKDNTKGNFVRANNYSDKMRGAGALVWRVKRERALEQLLAVLGVY